MPATRLVMPLLHKKVITLRGPTWYFDEGVFLDTIYDEDYGAFQRDDLHQYYKTWIDIRTTCLYINDPAFQNLNNYSKRIATQIKFVLNNYAAEAPVVLPYAALIQIGSRKAHIIDIVDIEAVSNPHTIRYQTYKIKSGSNRSSISNHYKIVSNCCNDHFPIVFALERFNSALTRHDLHDKIVDITISLESLISGTQELTYKFALHNSMIAESSPEARSNAFDLLKDLYIARSGIVHGDIGSRDKDKCIKEVMENWEKVVRIAKAALNYYLIFLHEKGRSYWDLHLKNLVFGLETRLVE